MMTRFARTPCSIPSADPSCLGWAPCVRLPPAGWRAVPWTPLTTIDRSSLMIQQPSRLNGSVRGMAERQSLESHLQGRLYGVSAHRLHASSPRMWTCHLATFRERSPLTAQRLGSPEMPPTASGWIAPRECPLPPQPHVAANGEAEGSPLARRPSGACHPQAERLGAPPLQPQHHDGRRRGRPQTEHPDPREAAQGEDEPASGRPTDHPQLVTGG
jgi:hypothetical protein